MESVIEHRHRRGVQSSKSHHKIQSNNKYKKTHDDKMRKVNSEQKERKRKEISKEKREKRKARDMINRNRNAEWRRDVDYYNYFGFMHKNKSYLMFPIKTKFFGLFLTKQSKLLIDRLVKQNKDIFESFYHPFHDAIIITPKKLEKYKTDYIKDLWKYKKRYYKNESSIASIINNGQLKPFFGFIDNTYHDKYGKKAKKKYDKLFIMNLSARRVNKTNHKYHIVLDYRNIEYILAYDYSICMHELIDKNYGFKDHKNRKITVNIPDVKPAYYFYKWKHNNSLPDDESVRRSDYVFVYNTKHKGSSEKE